MSKQRKFDKFMVDVHHGANPKIARLSDAEYRAHFSGILPIAALSPIRGCLLIGDDQADAEDVAKKAGVALKAARSCMTKLRRMGVLVPDSDLSCERVHDWDEWNPTPKKDATNTERQRRYRDRRLAASNAVSNAVTNGSVTGDIAAVTNTPVTATPSRDARTPEGKEEEEKTPQAPQGAPPAGFEQWLADHQAVTGHQPPGRGTKAFAAILDAYRARITEGWKPEDLAAATRGAHNDEYRREHGYDTASSVLRPTKVGDLVARGRRHQAADKQQNTGDFLAKLRGAAA